MRFWKAGLAAVIVMSAGAIGLAAARVDDQARREHQSVYSTDHVAPLARVMQAWAPDGSRIGVSVRDITADDLAEHKLSNEAGVLVTEVDEDAPAEKAGMREGDVILEFDGERVRSTRHLTRLVQETAPGRTVAAVVSRGGSRVTLNVAPEAGGNAGAFTFRGFDMPPTPPTPPAPPAAPHAPRAPRVPMAPMAPMAPEAPLRWFGDRDFVFSLGGGARLGVGIQPLSDQLATYFGVESGVLVTSVEEDSAAAKAGLRAGDVITKINDRTVEDGGDVIREIHDADGKVAIVIVRDKKTQTVTATIEASPRRTVRRVI